MLSGPGHANIELMLFRSSRHLGAGLSALTLLLGVTGIAATRASLAKNYVNLPLAFEANRGQSDGKVKFLARGRGYTLFLTRDAAVLKLSNAGQDPAILQMKLAGANPEPEITGAGELAGKSNYFIGNDPQKWRTNEIGRAHV